MSINSNIGNRSLNFGSIDRFGVICNAFSSSKVGFFLGSDPNWVDFSYGKEQEKLRKKVNSLQNRSLGAVCEWQSLSLGCSLLTGRFVRFC